MEINLNDCLQSDLLRKSDWHTDLRTDGENKWQTEQAQANLEKASYIANALMAHIRTVPISESFIISNSIELDSDRTGGSSSVTSKSASAPSSVQ